MPCRSNIKSYIILRLATMKGFTVCTIVLILAFACLTTSTKDKKQSNDPFHFVRRNSIVKRIITKLNHNLLRHGLQPKNQATPNKIDLLFLVETSRQYGSYEFKKTVYLAKRMLSFFSISPGTTRVGFITFNETAHALLAFDKYHNSEAVQKKLYKISKLQSSSQSASLTKGLEAAVKSFQSFTRPNTKRILVTFTSDKDDGLNDIKSFNKTLEALKELKAERIVIALKMRTNWKTKKTFSKLARQLATNSECFIDLSKPSLRSVQRYLPKAPYRFCPYHKNSFYDECHRRCSCIYGYRKNCFRVRQEWNSMSTEQKKLYIDTYVKLTSHPVHKPRYDKFISIHSINFMTSIHEAAQFLPWHRWYLIEMETLLKEVDCRVTLPYWDWSMVSNDPWNQTMLFSPQPHGFGTVNPDESDCVTTGPFAESKWRLPNGGCLERWTIGNAPTATEVQLTHNLKHFNDFEVALRINLHDTMHCIIGGTMCSLESASAPEFFLHHGMIEKLWHKAQQKRHEFMVGRWENATTKMVVSPYSAKQYLNLKHTPGYIRVTFSETTINHAQNILKVLAGESSTALLQMPRRRSNLISEPAMKLFKVNENDSKKAHLISDVLSIHPEIKANYSKQTGLPLNLEASVP